MIQSSFTLPCGQTIKNRVCKAAMTERIAKGDNLAHQGHINLYNTWADGDVGILLTGNVQVDRRNIEGPANVVIDKSNYHLQMETLKQWAAAGTKQGVTYPTSVLMCIRLRGSKIHASHASSEPRPKRDLRI